MDTQSIAFSKSHLRIFIDFITFLPHFSVIQYGCQYGFDEWIYWSFIQKFIIGFFQPMKLQSFQPSIQPYIISKSNVKKYCTEICFTQVRALRVISLFS